MVDKNGDELELRTLISQNEDSEQDTYGENEEQATDSSDGKRVFRVTLVYCKL